MENKFEINSTRATITLTTTVILFFLSVILGLIVFDSRQIWVKAAFLLLALGLVGLSFIAYRIFSGAYYMAIKDNNLILSRSLSKTIIPLSSIEKLDLVKGKSLFKGDDYFKIEYKKGKEIVKTSFLLFYIKDSGDKIYTQIISHLEKVA
jgi:hypothetical protein